MISVGWASQTALEVKNPPANAGDVRDVGLIPGLGRSPGGGHGHPPQYFCLENPMDRRAWWPAVHGVMKSWIQLSNFAHMPVCSLCWLAAFYLSSSILSLYWLHLMGLALWFPAGIGLWEKRERLGYSSLTLSLLHRWSVFTVVVYRCHAHRFMKVISIRNHSSHQILVTVFCSPSSAGLGLSGFSP